MSNKYKNSGKAALSLLLALFWMLSLASALGVVYSTYESRQAVQKLEELRRQSAGLKIISGQYLLEKSSWAAYSRIEDMAQDKLKMFVPESEKTILVYKK